MNKEFNIRRKKEKKMESKNEFEPFFVGVPHQKKPFIVPKYNIPDFPPNRENNDHYFLDDHDLHSVIDCDNLYSTFDYWSSILAKPVKNRPHQWALILIEIEFEIKKQNLIEDRMYIFNGPKKGV